MDIMWGESKKEKAQPFPTLETDVRAIDFKG